MSIQCIYLQTHESIGQLLNKEYKTKQVHNDSVILMNTCVAMFIYLSIQVIKYLIKSLPLQRLHLASKVSIKQPDFNFLML